MKTNLLKCVMFIGLSAVMISCGSSKKAAEADRKKQEQERKKSQLDEDKRRFEMQNNKDLK